MVNGMASATCTPRFNQPASTIVVSANKEPMDRSIIPVVSSTVEPTAKIIGMAIPRRMLIRLVPDRNRSWLSANPMNISASTIPTPVHGGAFVSLLTRNSSPCEACMEGFCEASLSVTN